MGQFSWLDCITGEQILDDVSRDSYVLVPEPFREKYGSTIKEGCYDGYGRFGGYDIYDLVTEWNKAYLSEDMFRPAPKLKDFGGLWDFEKKDLRKAGKTNKEISVLDEEARRGHYESALERRAHAIARMEDYRDGKLSDEEMTDKYGHDWKRCIGIDVACYDEQNAALPYPIKISHTPADYEMCAPSPGDPNQGWLCR
ncbi:MAG: hypothetical protein J5966_05105 [Lachnospiraceae bacterium]|nr:hypothetical protein [Lachnospiraceae bacterium]